MTDPISDTAGFLEILREWQTLVTGMIALAVGVASIIYIRKQIKLQREQFEAQLKQQREQFEHRLENEKNVETRKFLAVRATLPANLSEICQYARNCAFEISKLMSIVRYNAEQERINIPTLDDRVISSLQKFVENTEINNSRAIHELLSCYQIQSARIISEINSFNNPNRNNRHRIFTEDNINHIV